MNNFNAQISPTLLLYGFTVFDESLGISLSQHWPIFQSYDDEKGQESRDIQFELDGCGGFIEMLKSI